MITFIKSLNVVLGVQYRLQRTWRYIVAPFFASRLPLYRMPLVAGLVSFVSTMYGASLPNVEVKFNRDIRPILAEACYHCHGPDPASRKAKMRFDREEDFFSIRDDVAVVARGKPSDSLMWQRIITNDKDDVMPPPDSHNQLKPEQKELIRRWIEQGAKWEKHWSFIAPVRPALPEVQNATWAKNDIDRFISQKVEAAKLSPAPEADKWTLARRVSLDLTGLPPTWEEVEAFVADKRPDAYERYVDTLMAKPAYGEHRARYWLDAARYADTHGMHFDNYRDMWTYRDWVINAFNQNMKFDQFTVEQIAGDLLENPTQLQLIATGFQRCNMTTNEGGTIDEENIVGYARDRVETISWVYLGLTSNCAVCHDHKFDPITQRDFYSMSAYFRNTTQGAKDGNIRDTPPILVIPKESDKVRWDSIDGEMAVAKKELEERRKVLRNGFNDWFKKVTAESWNEELAKFPASDVHVPFTGIDDQGTIKATVNGKEVAPNISEPVTWNDKGPLGKAITVTGKNAVTFPSDIGDFEKDSTYSVSVWINVPKDAGNGSLLSRMDNEQGYRGWDIWVQDNEIATHLVHQWPDDALKVVTTKKALKRGTWQHITITYDGSAKHAGMKIYVDGELEATKAEKDNLKSSTRTTAPFVIARRKTGDLFKEVSLQDLRINNRIISDGEIKRRAATPFVKKLLAQKEDKRDKKQIDKLFDIMSSDDPEYVAKKDLQDKLGNEKKAIRQRSPVAHIQEEKMNSKAMAHILFRGEYDKRREEVEPGVYAALHPLPSDAPKNRLGLAQWLMSQQNGLTPRVVINRMWQELFGTGIVKSAEDFGIMGEAPSHPELLDWLAVEFSTDWDMKRMIKLMVMSATYRQAAVATADKIEADAENRLLSRGPRFRMDAEMIRDYALAASGIMTHKIGGPSVKPYQPPGVWEIVGMRESNTKIYKQDNGEDLYRRSMYSFWKRMAPPAAMEILNAPNREISCLRRERTNTPLQALVTLNDPQFIESARVLAEQVIKGQQDDDKRVEQVAKHILVRNLSEAEKTVASGSYKRLLDYYRMHEDEAKQLLTVGERKPEAELPASDVAALTMLCNQLFNLDEVLNK